MIPLFGAAIFLSAGLVFLVQPMTAKLLLPTFGGSPQVWTAATVFFQGALLAGYGYAHLSIKAFGVRRQSILHAVLLLLPLLVLPIGLRGLNAAGQLPPAIAVLAILLVSVGAPYVAVTATSPLLQRWFSMTGHRSAADPYFLYAAGNVGSLVGLLGYPLVVEPNMPLGGQALLWSAGYGAFVLLCMGCAIALTRGRLQTSSDGIAMARVDESANSPAHPITNRRRLGWIARAFIPSSLMLGVTTYSSTDIAAVPLLWAIPLSIYLFTFVLAFSPRRLFSTRTWATILPFTTILVILTIIGIVSLPIWLRLAAHYVGFFVAAMVAHGQLADDRPGTDHLTQFYLLVAVGGVLGGIFNALVAPVVFDAILEYPIVIVAALLLRAATSSPPAAGNERRARRLDLILPLVLFVGTFAALVAANRLAPDSGTASRLLIAGAVIGALVFVARPTRFVLSIALLLSITFLAGQSALFADRTFFGLNRVVDDGAGRHLYLSGATIHGAERTDPEGSSIPLSYYHPTGPAGDVFRSISPAGSAQAGTIPNAAGGARTEVALIGLGAGSLAAYGQPGQHFSFVDIDPDVIRIATDPSLFRFVADSGADIDIAEADGRLWLAAQADRSFDLIVLDAFSSDAVPAHLLTREAIDMYAHKLRSGGRLLFNVTNSYLDIGSVVAGDARSLGLVGFARHDGDLSAAPHGDKEVSDWVVIAPDMASLRDIAADPGWSPIEESDRSVVWRDDFSDILGVIK